MVVRLVAESSENTRWISIILSERVHEIRNQYRWRTIMTEKLSPPVAARTSTRLENHGDRREDPYYWLGDRDNPEVIEYLKAENLYADQILGKSEKLCEQLYQEIKDRIVDSDMSAPVPDGSYEYYYRENRDNNYITHYRRRSGHPDTEQLVIDENTLAEGYLYFRLRQIKYEP